MPLLGMFSKKSKQGKRSDVASTNSVHSSENADSAMSSPTTEYIRSDKSLPSSPNGRRHLHPNDAVAPGRSVYPTAGSPSSSSSKLRQAFGRKKGSATSSPVSERKSIGRFSSEESVPALPPPRPAFAAYGDTSKAHSTRSLPTNNPAASLSTDSAISTAASSSSRTPRRPFFNWSKSANSTPSKPALQLAGSTSPLLPPTSDDSSSFNLKSFRHLRPPSPTHSVSSTSSLSPPLPPGTRPRGTSTASDSSQRISVAAFREAQAKRSAAGSPSPSLRSPSPHGMHIRAPSPHGMALSAPSNKRSLPQVQSRPVSRHYLNDSDTSEEEEEGEEDSDDDQPTVRRRRTITQRRSGNGAASRAPENLRGTRSEMGHGYEDSDNVPTITPRNATRQRSSHSTSALAPNAAARRASQIASQSDMLRPARHSGDLSAVPNPTTSKRGVEPTRRSIVVSNPDSSSSSDSDDDAPLARLVPPRRPGSALSNHSNRSNPAHAKPLIDINSVIRQSPKTVSSVPSPSAAFTPGATLISGGLTSRSPPGRFITPPASPTKTTRTLAPVDATTKKNQEVVPRKIPLWKGTSDAPSNLFIPDRTLADSPVSVTSAELAALHRRPGIHQEESKEILPPSAMRREPPRKTSPEHLSLDKPSNARAGGAALGHRRVSSDHAPPTATSAGSDGMSDLASMLGGGIRLISKNGESESSEEEEDDDEDDDDEEEEDSGKQPEQTSKSFKPIPIQRRTPAPSFAVTSRPQNRSSSRLSIPLQDASPSPENERPASSFPKAKQSLATNSSGAMGPNGSPKNTSTGSAPTSPSLSIARQRSSTLLPKGGNSPLTLDVPSHQRPQRPTQADSPIQPRPRSTSMMQLQSVTMKPFTSPASSTGDSSSGMQPLTPRDGSEIGSSVTGPTPGHDSASGTSASKSSGLSGNTKTRGHTKQRKVSFEDGHKDKERKELERRRNEAKAAIELGNVVNGRGPIMVDDEAPVNQGRMSTAMFPQQTGWNMPMINMPMNMNSPMSMPMNMAMPQMMPPINPAQLLSPTQFMPPPSDPNFLMAHQQAMMYAKQAYQMAVAQQAMTAAAEEWERQSSMSYGGGSVYGGGSGVSGWGSQSMYGGGMASGARSEYGGGGGWASSQSMYGGGVATSGARSAYGAGARQSSGYFPPMPPPPSQSHNSNLAVPNGSRPSRPRTVSQPASPVKPAFPQSGSPSGATKKRQGGAPPSSWRPGM